MYAVDFQALVSGRVRELVEKGEIGGQIIVPRGVLAEVEEKARRGEETGLVGLEELKYLKNTVDLVLEEDVWGVMEAAERYNCVVVTGDPVTRSLLELRGYRVVYTEEEPGSTGLEEFFDDKTLSVHLRAGVPPLAKKGKPGNFRLVKIRKDPLTEEEIRIMARRIMEKARAGEGFVEIERKGAAVVQLGEYRVAIAFPPFSDAWEITAVRPLVKKSLEEYGISKRLLKRLEEGAEGIIIAGPPGAGKSTFAQALAEFYMEKGHVVKTMEHPRDLQVPPEVSQYSPLEGDMEKTADILLLVRPDYTIYDEMRKTRDFEIYADMRMAGVGMIGVVHASRPIEAVQRFLGRVDLGVIPQIVDTVIFIRAGEIEKVYSLSMTVKVPHGMRERDLARPVVEVKDFETGRTEYEIYVFGEETVVMPVREPRGPLELLEEQGYEVREEDGYILVRGSKRKISRLKRRKRFLKNLEERLGRPVVLEVK